MVLVDLDIRKGTLSRHFHKHPVGVTNYLADDSIRLDDIIHTDGKFDNLDIISSGTVAPNPAELLMDERLDAMVEELRQRYDYIIVDNVPVGIVADATITNRISDLTIFVVRAGRLDRRLLPDMEELYRDNKLRNMAIILNGVARTAVATVTDMDTGMAMVTDTGNTGEGNDRYTSSIYV